MLPPPWAAALLASVLWVIRSVPLRVARDGAVGQGDGAGEIEHRAAETGAARAAAADVAGVVALAAVAAAEAADRQTRRC
jgi:hypothetical protein